MAQSESEIQEVSGLGKYEIELTRTAEKEILRLDASDFSRLSKAIDNLQNSPRPPGVRKLHGRSNQWRIRIGRFGILFAIDDSASRILIYRVTDRKDVYK